MSNKYKEQAQDILTAVGGVENIVDATYDTEVHYNSYATYNSFYSK